MQRMRQSNEVALNLKQEAAEEQKGSLNFECHSQGGDSNGSHQPNE